MPALTVSPRPFRFEIVLADVDFLSEEAADALFEAGCDDGLCGSSCGVATVTFTRRAGTLEEAVSTAVRDIGRAGFQVRELRMDEEALTTISTASAGAVAA